MFDSTIKRKGMIKMRVHHLILPLIISLIAVSLMFIGISDADVENLAKGGDFENDADLSQWRVWQAAGVTTLTIDKKTAVTGKASLFVEIVKQDPARADSPNVYQSGHTAQKGETYTLSAWAKGEKNRHLDWKVRRDGAPWTAVLRDKVLIETEWKEYWVTDVSPETMPVQIAFENFGSDVNYWLDCLRFYEGKYEPSQPSQKQAVSATGKLSTTWGSIKAQYQ